MCLTFQMMSLEKYLTKNFEIFVEGTPFLAPQSAASSKMTTPALPMTPLFRQSVSFVSFVCQKKFVCPFVGLHCGCIPPSFVSFYWKTIFFGYLHAAYSALRHFLLMPLLLYCQIRNQLFEAFLVYFGLYSTKALSGFLGLSWAFSGTLRLCLVIFGYIWLPLVMSCNIRLPWATMGYPKLLSLCIINFSGQNFVRPKLF